MIKASQIILWIKKHVGDGYVYGTIGQTCTTALLKQCQSQYGASMGEGYYQSNGDYTKGRCGKWLNKWVCDCSGLIKSARKAIDGTWKDVSAQGTYDQCVKRGLINTMPLTPGCTVYIWSASKNRIGHVGMYIGAGQVIEARGVDYGVVITKLSGRAWTHWGLLNWLEYNLPTDNGKAVVGGDVDAGDATNPKRDDRMSYSDALEIIDGVIDIDVPYWTDRANIDKYFDDLIIKIAEKMKGDVLK